MSYLNDYIYYSSGNECPETYLWWGGLSILGHVLGHKTWIVHGDYFRFHPNLYVCLVGDAGSGKNTALGVNIEIMLRQFPELLLSSSIQSREDIADLMSSDACAVHWLDRDGHFTDPGEHIAYRPFYILNNELASFLSVDKMKMVEFLTEVYDGKRFSTGFKKDRRENPERRQWFDHPHVSLLAGAVPTWFMGSLKLDLFSGGLGRRLVIVHANRTKVIHDPRKPNGADAAMSRVIDHLRAARFRAGPVIRNAKALLWWEEWYTRHRNMCPDDPILSQFHQTKHMQLLKVATLLKLAERLDDNVITDEHLQASLALLESLETPIQKLTSGVGRNELAGVGAQVLALLEASDGWMLEKKLQAVLYRDVPGGIRGLTEVLQHLQKTDQIIAFGPSTGEHAGKVVIALPERYERFMKGKT